MCVCVCVHTRTNVWGLKAADLEKTRLLRCGEEQVVVVFSLFVQVY